MPARLTIAIAASLAAAAGGAAALATAVRPDGAPATCRHQSSAGFPRRSTDLVVGPLVLVGGRRYTPPEGVARFGGQKYPALVRAGHRVVVEIVRADSATASLLYADRSHGGPAGERRVADGDRAVDFRACSSERAGSSYGGRAATFWSGFILASKPRCVHLRIWTDGARTPRHARVALGRRCP